MKTYKKTTREGKGLDGRKAWMRKHPLSLSMNEARNLIYGTKGKLFKVIFRKKNGQFRRMICRLGVKKYLRGGQLRFEPETKNLIVVFDFEKQGYRMINLATLMYLTIAKVKYTIGD